MKPIESARRNSVLSSTRDVTLRLSSSRPLRLRQREDLRTGETRHSPPGRPLLSVGRWRIFRLDERNIVLTRDPADESSYLYYPTLRYAVGALLEKQIDEAARPGLASLRDAIQEARSAVVAALGEAPGSLEDPTNDETEENETL